MPPPRPGARGTTQAETPYGPVAVLGVTVTRRHGDRHWHGGHCSMTLMAPWPIICHDHDSLASSPTHDSESRVTGIRPRPGPAGRHGGSGTQARAATSAKWGVHINAIICYICTYAYSCTFLRISSIFFCIYVAYIIYLRCVYCTFTAYLLHICYIYLHISGIFLHISCLFTAYFMHIIAYSCMFDLLKVHIVHICCIFAAYDCI